jgi:glutamate synthase (ferredoxin)
LNGGGGQSFGAFIPKGLTLKLTGDANDGFGKGLSGGKLIVTPSEHAAYEASENVIVGNVALYGATSGSAYINGIVGERFMVRNSGATAVCEGCGDHGLEYMTGGRAVILGEVGKNFAAGMSGGIAYILDQNHSLYMRTNKSLIEMTELKDADRKELKEILTDYEKSTKSKRAAEILSDFESWVPLFKKIIPIDYKNMLTLIGKYEEQGIRHEQAVYEAFKDVSSGSSDAAVRQLKNA